MKKLTLTIALAFIVLVSVAQPKKHVYYDTIKTIQKRIDFAPDTIPIYFKELIVSKNSTIFGVVPWEQWMQGFVVWKTYVKRSSGPWNGVSIMADSLLMDCGTDFDKNDYEDCQYIVNGQFLYLDKTPVKNKVLFTVKR